MMGTKIASIKMINDRREEMNVELHTTDSGIKIITTHQNRYCSEMIVYTGAGIKEIDGIRVMPPFFPIEKLFTPED